jgi:hypothetical protein
MGKAKTRRKKKFFLDTAWLLSVAATGSVSVRPKVISKKKSILER